MKTISTIGLLILLIFISSSDVISQMPPFSGEWKLNREKTDLKGSQLFLSKIKVILRTDSLLTTRVYENSNGEEYPFVENISLDGKDCKITIYEMPRTSKAKFSSAEGLVTVESTTIFNGNNGEENFKASETWKIENGGNTLSIAFTNSSSTGNVTGTEYFDRVK
jgi:hypothetical protein